MPKYEFRCIDCKEIFETNVYGVIPKCSVDPDHQMKRLYSNLGIIFKGSGFYSTDKDK